MSIVHQFYDNIRVPFSLTASVLIHFDLLMSYLVAKILLKNSPFVFRGWNSLTNVAESLQPVILA